MKPLLTFIFVFTLVATPAASDDIDELKTRALMGDAEAQYDLGFRFEHGFRGVLEDHQAAAKWYRKAAGQGHARSQYKLGSLYDSGQGVPLDNKTAARAFSDHPESLGDSQGC